MKAEEAKSIMLQLDLAMAMLQDFLAAPAMDVTKVGPLCRDIVLLVDGFPVEGVQQMTVGSMRNMVFDAILRQR